MQSYVTCAEFAWTGAEEHAIYQGDIKKHFLLWKWKKFHVERVSTRLQFFPKEKKVTGSDD